MCILCPEENLRETSELTATPENEDFNSLRARMQPQRIGAWYFQPDQALLRKGDEEVRLNTKTLHVLLALLEHPDKGVSREWLLDRVWGSSYPHDGVVTRAIADLRSALGDGAGQQSYIRTLPKYGYRLVAKIQSVDSKHSESEVKSSRSFFLIPAIVLVVLSVLALKYFETTGTGSNPKIPTSAPRTQPLTSATGQEHQPRSVPGTEWLVYAAKKPDRSDWDLFRVSLADGTHQPVAVDPQAQEHGAGVSPDGQEIAYVRVNQQGCKVVAQSIVLGVPRVLAPCTNKFLTLVDWSPSGKLIAYTADETVESHGLRNIQLLNVDSGVQSPLTRGVSETGTDYYPRFSPSGQSLAFMRGEPQPDHRASVWIVNVETGQEKRLMQQPAQVGGMDWLDDKTLLIAVGESGRMIGKVVDIEGNGSQSIEGIEILHPEFIAGQQALAGVQLRNDRDLYLFDPSGVGSFVVASTADDHHGSLSNDGKWLAFISRRSGYDEIWLADLEADVTRQLTRFDGVTVRYPRWHPSGQSLIFSAQTPAGERLFIADLLSGNVKVLSSLELEATMPAWLPDGQTWVSGCKTPDGWGVCSGDLEQSTVVASGWYRPVPLPGNAVAVVDDKGVLFRLSLNDGVATPLWDGLPAGGRYGWNLAGDELFYLRDSAANRSAQLIQRNLTSGTSEVLLEALMPLADSAVSLANNGALILVTREQESSDDIVLMSYQWP